MDAYGNGIKLEEPMISMFSRATVTTTFEADRTIQPFYTGGDVDLDRQGRVLATCLGEDALLTDLSTGALLARIEGVGPFKNWR